MKELEQFLGGMSTEDFLKDYWNKKPLLIRQACPKASELASWSELIEFATDEDFESRIIYEDNEHYSVKDGPLQETDLKDQYTIACHALNLFSEDFKKLEDLVTSFIPHWEFDDIMATVSVKGASVGAHFDHYGVFILQGEGRREWFIQENPKQEFKEGLDIKILKEFSPDYSWILEPGDMIYIPPVCAHHGVTLEDSVSYSLGFKSLEDQHILKEFIYDMSENLNSLGFYKSEGQKRNKYELDDKVVDYFHNQLLTEVSNRDSFKSWLAHKLSSPRYPSDGAEENSCTELAYDLKFTYYKKENSYHCYVNESFIELDQQNFEKLNDIIRKRDINDAPQDLIKFLMTANAIY